MKKYTVNIGGIPHTMQLSDEDARRMGDRAVPVDAKAAPAPKNKARAPRTKAAKEKAAEQKAPAPEDAPDPDDSEW